RKTACAVVVRREGGQCGNEGRQDEGGLARARHPRDGNEPPPRDVDLQRVDGVDRVGGEPDATGVDHRLLRGALAYDDGFLAGEEAAEQRVGVTGEVGGGALGDDAAAVGARTGSDLDDPRGLAQDLDVVVDEDHGVAVGKQVVHDAEQTL